MKFGFIFIFCGKPGKNPEKIWEGAFFYFILFLLNTHGKKKIFEMGNIKICK